VDLTLLAGGVGLDRVEVRRDGGSEPLFTADRVDLSIEWRALLHGALVGEVELAHPVVNIVERETPPPKQLDHELGWAKRLADLYPFDFDRVAVDDGEFHLRALRRQPPVDVALRAIRVDARNLTNSRPLAGERPTKVSLQAKAQETGKIAARVEADVLAARPDFHLELEVVSLQLPELNDFLRAYGGIDVQRGRFDLVSKVDSREGRFDGYVEPLLRDVDVLQVEKEASEQSFFATIWEALVGAAANVVKNKPEDQLATRVPIRGTFDQPQVGVWGALVSLLENGYVEALRPRLEMLRDSAHERG